MKYNTEQEVIEWLQSIGADVEEYDIAALVGKELACADDEVWVDGEALGY